MPTPAKTATFNSQRNGLYLNKELLPGFSQSITGTLPLPAEDMSGTGSHTPQAETGDKAKELDVKTEIPYSKPEDLTKIIDLAEAKDKHEERLVYNILNATANAMKIKQVRFQDSITVREDDPRHLWQVTFKLIEYHSVAEKKQQRSTAKKNKKVAVQKPTGKAVATKPAETSGSTGFEKLMKAAEGKLQ